MESTFLMTYIFVKIIFMASLNILEELTNVAFFRLETPEIANLAFYSINIWLKSAKIWAALKIGYTQTPFHYFIDTHTHKPLHLLQTLCFACVWGQMIFFEISWKDKMCNNDYNFSMLTVSNRFWESVVPLFVYETF